MAVLQMLETVVVVATMLFSAKVVTPNLTYISGPEPVTLDPPIWQV